MARASSDETVFHAIACPTRRALLDALANGEQNVGELVAAVDISQSAVSQQLAVLKRSGLVTERAIGRYRHYSLRPAPLLEVDVWFARYRELIEQQLDQLGRVLDEMPDDESETPKRKRRSS